MTDQTNAGTPAPPPKPKGHSPRLPYLPALDGLRALAVIAVLFYHAGLRPRSVPGGFLGVEIFFTISGYLIASLLLSEWRETGRIVLKQFWLRRARRLLPALFAVIIGALAFSVVFLPDEVASLRSDALAAFGYSTNWYLIFSNKSYFETVGRPSMLQHLWSLAVEEQFYVFWPLVFVLTMRRWRERSMLIGVIVVALASALLMGVLYQPDVDPSRVYYGTDTRAAGILIGVALAFVWAPGRSGGRSARLPLDLIGFAALGALLIFCLVISEFDPFLYRGGFTLVGLSTAILVAASVHRKSRILQAVLGFSVLRWVGLRSYGIYLWHWPVFMLTRPQLDTPLDGLPLLALRFGLTLILAELSFRVVETPVRSGAIERSWQTLQLSEGRQRRQLILHWASAATAILLASVVLGSSVVRAQPPPPPAYLASAPTPGEAQTQAVPLIEGGPRAQPQPTATEPPAPPDTPVCAARKTPAPTSLPPTARPEPPVGPTAEREAAAVTVTATSAATETPSATIAPKPTAGPDDDAPERMSAARRPTAIITTPTSAASAVLTGAMPTAAPFVTPTVRAALIVPITALGDSVMQGAAPTLYQVFPGIEVDAEKGRQVYRPPVDYLIAQLQEGRTSGRLGQIVVLHLGNNGVYPKESFDKIMQTLADRRLVIVLNVRVPRQWEDNNNRVITEGIKRYPNAVLVDWYTLTAKRPELFWNDGHHLRPEGAQFYAELIQKTIATYLSQPAAP
jgi:peptidoglycan/LPS O-acetylase OafA/YrhL